MRDRGYLFQCTNLKALDTALLSSTPTSPLSAYLGFDATADSLHVGSLLQIMILRHLQKSGAQPVVLVGGATSKVGDPTGKDESRKMLDDDDIGNNIKGISKVFETFINFEEDNEEEGQPKAKMVNNEDWLGGLKYLNFLRDYGTYFTVNRMLSFESVKQRMARENPLSFLEFNYMILQAYDFLELSRREGVQLQLGGSDQWGNIVQGVELTRKVDQKQVFGLTAPLITTSDGKKMGKTEGGAIWLNADKFSPYEYWQFWRNTADADVARFLKLFTEIPLDVIEKLSQLEGASINEAKKILADEATALLHGPDCIASIRETADNLFASKSDGAAGDTSGLERVVLSRSDLGTAKAVDMFLQLKLATSKKDAKRLIAGGGARIVNEQITDEAYVLREEDFVDGECVLRAGKKRAGVVVLEE
ncbi:hypothetical protein TrVE_jg12045 [Triparma verrucosa]|uniref:Tyrosine--tRNA ligase n=1 Tax=Triparma verrucosa TaxID=1606542 RepID=A0A9W7CF90_9STRA|nr:hypothetical protein TrVE_jg12045 [Triparma verrucosa]